MSLEAYRYHLSLLPVVFLGWLAVVVARLPQQRKANRLFAVFLLTVALGFTLEFFWGLFLYVEGEQRLVFRTAQDVLGIVDPPLLLAYAVTVFSRRLPKLPFWIAATAIGTILFFFTRYAPPGDWQPIASLVYVNGTYLVAFVVLLLAFARESRRYLSRQLRFLAIGAGFIGLSRSGAIFYTGPSALALSRGHEIIGAATLFSLAVLLGVWSACSAYRRPATRKIGGLILQLTALMLGFYLCWLGLIGIDQALGSTQPLGIFAVGFYGYRWVVFAAVVGYGILRYQSFNLESALTQAGAFAVSVPIGVVAAMATGASIAERPEPGAQATALAVFAATTLVVGLLARWFSSTLVAREAFEAGYRRRRLQVYEATLEYALEKPEWSEEERRLVESLREVFEISPEEHRQVAARIRGADVR